MRVTEADVALLEDVAAGRVIRVWPRDEDVRTFPRLRVRARVAALREQGLVELPPATGPVLSTSWRLTDRGRRVLERAHERGMGSRAPTADELADAARAAAGVDTAH